MVVRVLSRGKVTFSNFSQRSNAPTSRTVRRDGIAMLVKLEHFENANDPISEMLVGKVISCRLVHPSKALLGMIVKF